MKTLLAGLGTFLVFFILACCVVSGMFSKLEEQEELDSLMEK